MSEAKESKTIRILSYTAPILLVSYVLSIGPLAAIIYDSNGNALNPESEKLATRFYAPLAWVANKNEYVGKLFISYIEFCKGTKITDEDL